MLGRRDPQPSLFSAANLPHRVPTDFPGFDPSSLTYFRQRLIEHQKERYAFDRFVEVGREAGFIPDRFTPLTDTTLTKGARAVMDTYTLLRKGIRKLLKQCGYAAASKQRGLSPETQRLIATYVAQDRKAKLDWTDPEQRAAQLKVLFQDAEAALQLTTERMDDADVRSTGWLLVKINTRYLGHPKRQLQRLWQAAATNLSCLVRLCESRKKDLNTLLARLAPAQLRSATA